MATLRRNTPDYLLLLAILALLGLGLVMVASASTVRGLQSANDPFHFIKHQLVYAVLGLAGMIFMMNFDYHRLRRLTIPAVVIVTALLVLVLVLGQRINGAKRWLNVFGLTTIQPSEFAKLGLVLFLAHYLTEIGEGVRRLAEGVVVPLLFTGIFAALIMLEPDFGTTLVVCGTLFSLILAAGAHLFHLALLGAGGIAGLVHLAVSAPYRFKRLTTFLHPFQDPQGAGYQIIQSLYAFGSGGPFGVGIGRSRQKFSYLPEAHTDYIFSILGEEMGLIGTLFVLFLFFLVVWRGFRAALAAKDNYGMFLAVGITALFGIQAILNIGVVTSTLPVTGITLPLLSSGGSSLFTTLIGVGILLNVSRQTRSLSA